jgi:hypothetical protein
MNTSGRKMKVFGSSLTSPSLSLAISHTHIYRWFCRRAAVPGQPAGSSCRGSVGCRRKPPAASGTPTRAARQEQSCRHPVFSTASPGTDLQPPQFPPASSGTELQTLCRQLRSLLISARVQMGGHVNRNRRHSHGSLGTKMQPGITT